MKRPIKRKAANKIVFNNIDELRAWMDYIAAKFTDSMMRNTFGFLDNVDSRLGRIEKTVANLENSVSAFVKEHTKSKKNK